MAIINVTAATWQRTVLASKLPVVAGFWASWCHFCKRLDPVLDQLSEDFDGRILFVKVNVAENPDLARKYGIHNLPTTKFLKSGRPSGEVVGAVPREQLKAEIEKVLGIQDPSEISSAFEKKTLIKARAESPVANEPWDACVDAYAMASDLYFTSSHLLVDMMDRIWERSVASSYNQNIMDLTRNGYKAIGDTYANLLKSLGMDAEGVSEEVSAELERATCEMLKLYWNTVAKNVENMESLVRAYLRD